MAPNASLNYMEYSRPSTMSSGPKPHHRRPSVNGRSSLSPSYMLYQSFSAPSFHERFPQHSEVQHSSFKPCADAMKRDYPPYQKDPNWPYSVHKILQRAPQQNSQFYPKRRSQSECNSYLPSKSNQNQPDMHFNSILKSSTRTTKSSVSKSKSAPTVLPSTAVTCTELEAMVSKNSQKLLTCAELEALQAQGIKMETNSGLSRSPSVSSVTSALEELSSRPSSPISCSSPVPSVSSSSSGYESCSGDVFESTTKSIISVLEDSTENISEDEAEFLLGKKKVSKSLLSFFNAVAPKPSESQDEVSIKVEKASSVDVGMEGLIPFVLPSKFVQENKSVVSVPTKSVQKKTQKKKPCSSNFQPTPIHSEKSHAAHTLSKNMSASGCTSRKNSRKMTVVALPPSPNTVMPLMTSPPVALNLPSPPKQWRNVGSSPADSMTRISGEILDVTQQMKKIAAVTVEVPAAPPITVC
ncbi:uncharacterized protein LOC108681644 [Hyalella azteca]|uniref:Uncharacterized protein LOC108681644 n=1 Tax=Hyalella azteca TaxID=294128 RepID=A0A8B7PL99_HYAAZ|nr:uncharacterized protein LOC108681644 [Hyalella azteca]